MKQSDKITVYDNGRIRALLAKKASASFLSDLTVHEVGYGKCDSKPTVIVRDTYILQFLSKGKGKFNGSPISNKNAILIVPNTVEKREPDLTAPYYCGWIMFNGTVAKKLLEPFFETVETQVFDFTKSPQITEILRQVTLDDYSENDLALKFMSVFYEVLSYLPKKDSSETKSSPVILAIDYIKRNYNDAELKISDIAKFACVSRSHLCRLFNKEFGISIIEALIQYRLQCAFSLLCNTDMPISEISYSVGIPDSKYFSQIFLHKVGSSPSEYRKSHRKIIGD